MTLPAFAQPAGRWVRANRTACEVISVCSMSLAVTIWPLAAVPVVVTTLASDGDGGAAFQSSCRQASIGCDLGALCCTIAGFAGIVSIVGLPVGVGVSAIGAAFVAFSYLFSVLGKGQSPSLGALSAVAGPVAALSGSSTLRDIAALLAKTAKENPEKVKVQPVATTLPTRYPWALRRAVLVRNVIRYANENPGVNDVRPAVMSEIAVLEARDMATIMRIAANPDFRRLAEKNEALTALTWLTKMKKTPVVAWNIATAKDVMNDPDRAPTSTTPVPPDGRSAVPSSAVPWLVGAIIAAKVLL